MAHSQLPHLIKRGFVSNLDRKMVTKAMIGECYNIMFSSKLNIKACDAQAHYKSDLSLLLMARLYKRGLFTPADSGNIADYLDGIASRGWVTTFCYVLAGRGYPVDVRGMLLNPVAIRKELLRAERLIFKCYRYCVASGDYFKTMHLIKSYCLEVLEMPEVAIKSYMADGVKWCGAAHPDVYKVGRLMNTEAFKALPAETNSAWLDYLMGYAADVKPVEKLLAVRDHANDLVADKGEDYKFIVKACEELLL